MSNEEIKVRFSADGAGLREGAGAAAKGVADATGRMRDELGRFTAAARQAEQQATQSFRNMVGGITSMVAAYASIASIKALANVADGAALANARIQNLTGSTQATRDAQAQLYEMSQRLQSSYKESLGTFARLLPAVKELGGGVNEAVKLSEILVTTAKLSGASADEAAASAQQFAQALGSGKLQGDELRSILENNQTLARTLTSALGVGIGELRKMGEEGKLTSEVVANALMGAYDSIKGQAAELPQTVGGAWTQIENAFTKTVEAFETGTGVFAYLAKILGAVASVLEVFAARLNANKDASDKLGQSSGAVTFAQMVGKGFAYVLDLGEALVKMFTSVGGLIGGVAAAVGALMSGNMAGAADVMNDAVQRYAKARDDLGKAAAGRGGNLAAYAATIDGAASYSNEGRGSTAGPAAALKGKKIDDGKGKAELMSKLEAELQARREAVMRKNAVEREGLTFTAADEARFWQDSLKRKDLTEKEKVAIKRKASEAELKVLQEGFGREMAGLRMQEVEAGNNAAKRAEIARQESEKIAGWYGRTSKEFMAAEQSRVQAAQAAAAQVAQIQQMQAEAALSHELNKIERQQELWRNEADARNITVQELLAIEQQYEDRKYQLRLQGLQAALTATPADRDPVRYAQILAQIQALEDEHQARVGQLRIAADKEQRKYSDQLFSSMESGFASVLMNFTKGTTTIGGLFRQLGQTILQSMLGVFAQIGARWLALQVMQRAFGKATAISEINANVAKAGAGGTASMAAAPFPLNLTAPMFGAAMAAAASGFAVSLPSARGGFDIPAGLNPVTQLHEREMVLPEAQADAVRDMAGGGGERIVIQTTGGQFIHRDQLAGLLKRLNRNFEFVGA